MLGDVKEESKKHETAIRTGVQCAMTAIRVISPETKIVQAKPSSGMTNEQLAHELLVDRNFRLDDKVYDTFYF